MLWFLTTAAVVTGLFHARLFLLVRDSPGMTHDNVSMEGHLSTLSSLKCIIKSQNKVCVLHGSDTPTHLVHGTAYILTRNTMALALALAAFGHDDFLLRVSDIHDGLGLAGVVSEVSYLFVSILHYKVM